MTDKILTGTFILFYVRLMEQCAQSMGGPGPEVLKLFSCSAQLRLKFILLIYPISFDRAVSVFTSFELIV